MVCIGWKAIELLKDDNNVPDIILMDIVMPGMSGVEVAKWIFENKKEIQALVNSDDVDPPFRSC